jgi:hypothetical protein
MAFDKYSGPYSPQRALNKIFIEQAYDLSILVFEEWCLFQYLFNIRAKGFRYQVVLILL